MILIVCWRLGDEPRALAEWLVAWAVFAGILYSARPWLHGIAATDNINWLRAVSGAFIYGPLAYLGLGARYWLRSVLILMCIASTSSKVYIGAVIGLFSAVLVAGDRKWGITAVATALVAASIAMAYGPHKVVSVAFIGKSEESIQSGTGRFTLWREYGEIVRQAPFVGMGFCVGERAAVESGASNIPHAHNAMWAAMLGTGLIGVGMVALFLFDMVYLCAKQQTNWQWRRTLVANAAMGAFITMFATGIGSRVDESWVSVTMFAGMVGCLARGRQCIKMPTAASRKSVSFVGLVRKTRRVHRMTRVNVR